MENSAANKEGLKYALQNFLVRETAFIESIDAQIYDDGFFSARLTIKEAIGGRLLTTEVSGYCRKHINGDIVVDEGYNLRSQFNDIIKTLGFMVFANYK